MDRRVFITTLVCLGILIFWQTYVNPPPRRLPHVASSQPADGSKEQVNGAGTNAAGPNATVSAAPASATAPAKEPFKEALASFDQPLFTAEVSNLGGGLHEFTLKKYREGGITRGSAKHPVSLVGNVDGEALPTAVLSINGAPFPFAEVTAVDGGVKLAGDSQGLHATAKWQAESSDYMLSFAGEIVNTTNAPLVIEPDLGMHGLFNEQAAKKRGMFEPPPENIVPIYDVAGDVFRHAPGKKDKPQPPGSVSWAGVDRQYFLVAAAPQNKTGIHVDFAESHAPSHPQYLELAALLKEPPQTLAPGGKWSFAYQVYAGPKANDTLKAPNLGFEDAVDYTVWGMPLGFLARPMLWVLNTAYSLVHSYGLAILILTLVVKLLMWPVTHRAQMSMQVMRELKPELDKIKERFPNDRERQGVETMRLYKERGANPFLSGCLPALLQMPVFLALWRTLWAAVQLYQQEFLWLGDLTAKDPYYILPLLLGATMFIQQRMMPPAGDPQQQKIMMFLMPPMMTVFMINLPSGLVFYYFVNNILTILQQAYISRKFAKPSSLVR